MPEIPGGRGAGRRDRNHVRLHADLDLCPGLRGLREGLLRRIRARCHARTAAGRLGHGAADRNRRYGHRDRRGGTRLLERRQPGPRHRNHRPGSRRGFPGRLAADDLEGVVRRRLDHQRRRPRRQEGGRQLPGRNRTLARHRPPAGRPDHRRRRSPVPQLPGCRGRARIGRARCRDHRRAAGDQGRTGRHRRSPPRRLPGPAVPADRGVRQPGMDGRQPRSRPPASWPPTCAPRAT